MCAHALRWLLQCSLKAHCRPGTTRLDFQHICSAASLLTGSYQARFRHTSHGIQGDSRVYRESVTAIALHIMLVCKTFYARSRHIMFDKIWEDILCYTRDMVCLEQPARRHTMSQLDIVTFQTFYVHKRKTYYAWCWHSMFPQTWYVLIQTYYVSIWHTI